MSKYYLWSMPERVLRAGTAIVGGFARETSDLLLPGWIRSSHLYQATIARLLRITVELVGDVQGVYSPDQMSVQELTARKAAGNVVELASFLAVGWSPLWLLAAVADLTNGTRTYLQTLVAELKAINAIPADASISSVDELLATLEQTSGTMADTIDVPPLNVTDMRSTWQELQQQAGRLPDAETLGSVYEQLQAVSAQEGRSMLEVSSAVAAGAVRAGIKLGDVHIFGYYRETLAEIGREGWLHYVRRIAQPYLLRAITHFDPRSLSYTERMLQRRDQP